MKRHALIVPAVLGALSLATFAWAGGSSCSGKSEGAATAGSHCTVGSSKEASTGAHCTLGASAASKEACEYGANHAVYSFAVTGMHCSACVKKVQSAAMAQKGVHCVHVDLDSKTAYVVGEKKLDERVIAKAIKGAGFACDFKSDGPNARTAFMKAVAAGGSTATCSARKDKDKV